MKSNINKVPDWRADVGTYCLIVGYKNDGNTLDLLLYDKLIIEYNLTDKNELDLIFIGDKKRDVSLEDIYLSIIKQMRSRMTLPSHDGMYFGASAYRK